MGAVRSSRPALRLPRDRPQRAHHRPAAPARGDHQGRLHPRPPTARRGRLPLPPRRGGRRGARAPPTPTATRDHQHLPQSTTPAERALAPAQETPVANPPGSSRSRSPASSPPTAGRSPPTRPQPRCPFPHRPAARDSPTHAEPPSNIPLRLARRSELPGSRTQLRDPSPEHPPPGRARSTLDSGRATNKGLGPAPEYEHDQPSRTPRTPGPPRHPQPQLTPRHQPHDGHQPMPLDNDPSKWAMEAFADEQPLLLLLGRPSQKRGLPRPQCSYPHGRSSRTKIPGAWDGPPLLPESVHFRYDGSIPARHLDRTACPDSRLTLRVARV